MLGVLYKPGRTTQKSKEEGALNRKSVLELPTSAVDANKAAASQAEAGETMSDKYAKKLGISEDAPKRKTEDKAESKPENKNTGKAANKETKKVINLQNKSESKISKESEHSKPTKAKAEPKLSRTVKKEKPQGDLMESADAVKANDWQYYSKPIEQPGEFLKFFVQKLFNF